MKRWIVPFPKFGVGSCLPRLPKIAARLNLDLASFGEHAAVIVGSNGKGSTAAMTASLLQQARTPVGLFTSPHMLRLNERFRIDAQDISDDALLHHWRRALGAIDAAGESANVGGFEFLFLIAADWFAASGCTRTVWEAGIGGRLDPVRLIAARRLALTSLDFEHIELLGDSLAAIACDKIDAAPNGATLFFNDGAASERVAIEAHCALGKVRPIYVPPLDRDVTSLPGGHQRLNAGLALALARELGALSAAQVEAGFAATVWPGRLEVLQRHPLVVIDVGHTRQGVAAALHGFQEVRQAGETLLICGVSRDKDIAAVTEVLAPSFGTVICVSAKHKGAPAACIAAACAAAHREAEIIVAEDVASARTLALTRVTQGSILVAGGFFLASEFKAAHLGIDPASLDFV